MKKFIININLFLMIVLALNTSSCTKIIEVEVDPSNEKLVVDATLTTDSAVHKVILTRSINYFTMSDPKGVSNATVTITDNEGTVIPFEENEQKPGEYLSPDKTCGKVGNQYTLNIKLTSPIGGFSEYSASNTIKKTPDLDSIKILKDPYRPFYYIAGYFQDSISEDYYMNWYSKDDTLKTFLSTERNLIEDKVINGSYFDGVAMAFIFGDEINFMPLSIFEVTFANITEQYYNFLSEFATEANGQNPLFSGPPANVSSNLNNEAVGFFATYQTKSAFYVIPG